MSENERALREVLEQFNSDLDRILAGEEVAIPDFWSPDVELVNFEPSPFPGTYRGREGQFQWTKDIFGEFTDGRIERLEVVEEDDMMAVKLCITAKGRGSGIEGTLIWGALFEIKDGQCVRVSSDMDFERTLERLPERQGPSGDR